MLSRAAVLLIIAVMVSGCASYHSHHSSFTAVNSQGEERDFRLTWRTATYPGWHWRGTQVTPVRLETQCSRRTWRLRDPDMNGACSSEGIAACGDQVLDLDRQGRMLAGREHVCLSLTDEQGSTRIKDLGSNVELTVACYPAFPEIDMGDDVVNADYLQASVVPYNLRMRKAPLGSMTQRPRELDDSVCDVDGE